MVYQISRLKVNKSQVQRKITQRLPTLEEALAAEGQKMSDKPDMLVDGDIHPRTVEFLKRLELRVVDVRKTRLRDSPDENIFATVQKIGEILIVTHDRGYLNAERFDLANSRGVVILPSTQRTQIYLPHSSESLPLLKAALLHFQNNFSLACASRVLLYTLTGDLLIFEPPFRPNRKGIIQRHYSLRYIPDS